MRVSTNCVGYYFYEYVDEKKSHGTVCSGGEHTRDHNDKKMKFHKEIENLTSEVPISFHICLYFFTSL